MSALSHQKPKEERQRNPQGLHERNDSDHEQQENKVDQEEASKPLEQIHEYLPERDIAVEDAVDSFIWIAVAEHARLHSGICAKGVQP